MVDAAVEVVGGGKGEAEEFEGDAWCEEKWGENVVRREKKRKQN